MLHYRAWEMGIKSLYYLRSKAIQRAGFAGGVEADNTAEAPKFELAAESTDFDESSAYQTLDDNCVIDDRSEEHTSAHQTLMRTSYVCFLLIKKNHYLNMNH